MANIWLRVAPALLALAQLAAGDDPRVVVREARRAVEGDSVPAVRARWAARLTRDGRDRSAALGLATLARLTYDYPDAERRYAALAAPPADRVARYALLGAGWAADTRGALARADTLFSRAAALAHAARDSAAEAEALAGLGMERGPVAGAAAGLAIVDAARRLAPASDTALASDIAMRRTILMAVLSNPGAGAEGRRALALARAAHEPRLEGRALRAIALDAHLRGEEDSSAVVLVEAERVQRAARDRSALAETMIRRADVFHSRGDVGMFKLLLERTLPEARASHNNYALSAATVGLAVVALQTGDVPTARALFAEAERSSAAAGDSGGVVTARNNAAEGALAAGDLDAAETLSLGVHRYYQHTRDATEDFGALRVLAAIERRRGNYAGAMAWLDTAAALSRARDRSWASNLRFDRGVVELARGDAARARPLLAAYVAQTDTGDHVPRYEARVLLADADARTGDYAAAERELAAASDEIDSWRATLSDRDLRTLVFQVHSHDVDERMRSAAAVLGLLATHGRAPAAFALAERRRARELDDRLVRAAALDASAKPETTGDAKGDARPAARDAAHGAVPTAGAADALLAGGPATAILEYVTGSGGVPTTLFVVTRAAGGAPDVRGFALASADSLAPLVARLDAMLEGRADPAALERSLGDALLGPAAGALAGVTRLLVVPDGPLHRVPFDALRMADGRHVVERFAVTVAPSVAVAAELRRRGARHAPGTLRLLAFGDPAFARPTHAAAPTTGAAAADDDREFRSAFDATGGLPRLAASGDEARTVARYASDAVVRLGADASAAYLKGTDLAGFDVIHFATHALVDDRAASRSALALAPTAGESGFVSAVDLARLRLAAGLVVLSACRTAGGVVVDGEGVQGLTAPILEAGARSVVATQWRVRDRATVPFVDAFYRGLADGLPVAEALRGAKLDAIRRGAPAADWAAFTAVGDPSVQVALREPSDERRWAYALAGVLAIVAAGTAFGHRRRRTATNEAGGAAV